DSHRDVPLAEAPPPAASPNIDDVPIAPGTLPSHYAPRARLRLDAQRVEAQEALLAFGPTPAAGAERAAAVLNLSRRGDLIEAAAHLFSHLRALAAAPCGGWGAPGGGLGEGIKARLAGAAPPPPGGRNAPTPGVIATSRNDVDRARAMNIAEAPAKFLATDLLARFVAIVGSKNAITDREAQAPYLTEPRDMFRGASPVALPPGSVPEAPATRELASET